MQLKISHIVISFLRCNFRSYYQSHHKSLSTLLISLDTCFRISYISPLLLKECRCKTVKFHSLSGINTTGAYTPITHLSLRLFLLKI